MESEGYEYNGISLEKLLNTLIQNCAIGNGLGEGKGCIQMYSNLTLNEDVYKQKRHIYIKGTVTVVHSRHTVIQTGPDRLYLCHT